MANCCQLVGNYQINGTECFVSINTGGSTEGSYIDNTLIIGPTVGTASVVGLANNGILHEGCAVRANVSFNWVRKWDCDNNILHFIPAGLGQSYATDGASQYGISVKHVVDNDFRSISVSSDGGPAALYQDTVADSGFGLSYAAGPIDFSAEDHITNVGGNIVVQGITVPGSFIGLNVETMYLQSFNFDAQPAQPPRASYSFVFEGMPK